LFNRDEGDTRDNIKNKGLLAIWLYPLHPLYPCKNVLDDAE
jgi:hypothetical protein